MDKLHKELAARSCRTLLYDLAGRDAIVELHLQGGQTFTGYVIKIAAEGQLETLILSQARSQQLTYLSVSAVCGITLGVSPQTIPVITAGRVQSTADLNPLTRLGFRRRLAELEAKLATDLGRPMPLACDEALQAQTEGLAPIMASIESLLEVLLKLRDDKLGQQALKSITSLQLSSSDRKSVSLEGGTLKANLDGQADTSAWQTAVEAAL